MTATQPRFLTEAELCAMLGISKPTAGRWRRAGIGPAFCRLGPKRLAYETETVDAWLRAQERVPMAA